MTVESNRNDFDVFGIILGERHKVLRGDYASEASKRKMNVRALWL